MDSLVIGLESRVKINSRFFGVITRQFICDGCELGSTGDEKALEDTCASNGNRKKMIIANDNFAPQYALAA